MLTNPAITKTIQRQGLAAPLTVTWEITNRCNLRCTHCLSDSGPDADVSKELSLEQAKGVVDQLASNQVFQIHFGGGEPFTYPGFFELLRHAQSQGFCCLCISTNGALLTEDRIQELEKIGGIYLQISLDGATEEVCDSLRGAGAFRRAMSALERLKDSNIVRTINFVYCQENAHQLDAMQTLAKELDATLRVTRLKPSGRGAEVYQAQRPTQEQFSTLHSWLSARQEVLTGDTFFHLNALGDIPLGGFQFCGAGRMTCLITPNGDVFPCAFTQTDSFLAGNLTLQPFEVIWNSAPVFTQVFRGQGSGACQGCEAFDDCGGGCPAVKHAVSGRLDVPDPDCMLGRGISNQSQNEKISGKSSGLVAQPFCAAD